MAAGVDAKEDLVTPVSSLNRVRRLPKRAHYDVETVHAILEEGMVAHVGFVDADGGSDRDRGDDAAHAVSAQQPVVIPMIYGRVDDVIYLHGSISSRLLKSLARGCSVCITVTLLDGVVLARSIFHHSMNYRSVVVFGQAYEVTDDDEKMRALAAVSEHACRGRWDQVRPPNKTELKSTKVAGVRIEYASAKIRVGPPGDDADDLQDDKWGKIWAGVLPIKQHYGVPEADSYVPSGVQPPTNVAHYTRTPAAAANGAGTA